MGNTNMPILAIVLVCLSALLHASWNLLAKKKSSGPAFLALAMVVPSIILSPLIITSPLHALDKPFWVLLALSGASQVLYLVALSLAYRAADIGSVYPISRALPVLMVALVGLLAGNVLPLVTWVGMVMLTIGCLLVPLVEFKEWSWRSYLTHGCFWAFITALGIVGYSIADNQALAVMEDSFVEMSTFRQALLFLALQSLSITLWMFPALCFAVGRRAVKAALPEISSIVPAGVMIGLTYSLVLYAMTMTENVAYIVALRQLSIPIGVILGVIFLHERLYRPRLIGALLVCVGLVIVNLP